MVKYLIRRMNGTKKRDIPGINANFSKIPKPVIFEPEVMKKITIIIIEIEIMKEVIIKDCLPQFFNFFKPNAPIILMMPIKSFAKHNCI